MNRFTLSFILMVAFALASTSGMQAEVVDMNSARATALEFINDRALGNANVYSHTIELAYIRTSDDANEPAFYVFNIDKGGGWVIVAGEDRAQQVLMYSKTGAFNPLSLPESQRAWLDNYSCQIEYLNHHPELPRFSPVLRTSSRENVEIMLETRWHQNSPFNYYCPNGIVGCTNTAMTQVMYYYKFPQDSIPEIPGYVSIDNKVYPSLPPTKFEWDLILPVYKSGEYTSENGRAVAQLAHYCGKSIMSWYSNVVTMGWFYYIPRALKNYYGYDASATYLIRDDFTYETWEEMVYQQIRARHPLVYSGYGKNANVGHAFVLDGYEDGYYHVNWGGGGSGEYVSLNALGYGGADTYNYDQDMVVNFMPDEGGDYTYSVRSMKLLSPLKTSVDSTISIRANTCVYIYPYNYHAQLVAVNKTSGEKVFIDQDIRHKYVNTYSIYDTLKIVLPQGFPQGLYELKPVFNRSQDGTEGSWEEGLRGDALPRVQMLVAGNYVKLGEVAVTEQNLRFAISDVTWMINAILAGNKTLTIKDVTTVINLLLANREFVQ